MAFFVYILECKDKYLYTGITGNLDKRLKEHRDGLTPFTKNKLPIKIMYTEEFLTRIEAAKKEKEIKGWSRNKKLNYISSYFKESQLAQRSVSDEAGTSSVG